MDKEVIVRPPNISEETKLKMIQFFMKTSIPRILAKEATKKAKNKKVIV